MWVKVTLTATPHQFHHAFDRLFDLRNCAWLIMDERVIIGALMRTLNYVLSLSFERCGHDLAVIVWIPVATLANETQAKKEGCKGRILETTTSPKQM